MMHDSKRYGMAILETLEGRWYWCAPLMDINYVPKGGKTSIHRHIITVTENDLNNATRVACSRESQIRKGRIPRVCKS